MVDRFWHGEADVVRSRDVCAAIWINVIQDVFAKVGQRSVAVKVDPAVEHAARGRVCRADRYVDTRFVARNNRG